jgi:hypothetical protein
MNLRQSFISVGARQPFPKHVEALTAYATLDLGVPISALAKYLHLSPSLLPALPSYESDSSLRGGELNIPRQGVMGGLLGQRSIPHSVDRQLMAPAHYRVFE